MISLRSGEPRTENTVDSDLLDSLVDFIRGYLLLPSVKKCPESLSGSTKLEQLLEELMVLRSVLFAFAKGNPQVEINLKGFMAGCLKQLQAHLRHLEWHADQIATGDFNQKVDFMGPISESFNNMSTRLAILVRQLEEKEDELIDLAVELKLEIESRKQKEEQLRQSEERWKLAIACSLDGIWDVDLKTGACYCSPRFLDILHFESSSVPISYRWDLWMHPDDIGAREKMRSMLLEGRDPGDGEFLDHRFLCGDGIYRWMETRCMVLRDQDGAPTRVIGVTEDAEKRHLREDILSQRATHDSLTGLPNRYLYEDRLQQYIAMAKRHKSALVMIVCDLDDFKTVNDKYGHLAGDNLLKMIARCLVACVRETDTVTRFGGDEFVILLPCDRGQEDVVSKRAISDLFRSLEKGLVIDSEKIVTRMSCGGAAYPRDTDDPLILFSYADKALYAAKKSGKSCFRMWQESPR